MPEKPNITVDDRVSSYERNRESTLEPQEKLVDEKSAVEKKTQDERDALLKEVDFSKKEKKEEKAGAVETQKLLKEMGVPETHWKDIKNLTGYGIGWVANRIKLSLTIGLCDFAVFKKWLGTKNGLAWEVSGKTLEEWVKSGDHKESKRVAAEKIGVKELKEKYRAVRELHVEKVAKLKELAASLNKEPKDFIETKNREYKILSKSPEDVPRGYEIQLRWLILIKSRIVMIDAAIKKAEAEVGKKKTKK